MHCFFFPNAQKALKNMKNSLRKSGKIEFQFMGVKIMFHFLVAF